MDYPHQHIWINGRTISISSIVLKSAVAKTPFEENTFVFIAEWLSEKTEFQTNTSGSTGEPKTISFTRRQMIAGATGTKEALRLTSTMTALICIDTKYIGGKMMLVRSLEFGMKILALDPEAYPIQKLPIDHCVNFAAFVPYQIYAMLESKHPHLLDTIDVAIIGGAPLADRAVQQLQSYQSVWYLTYGMTETISHVALRKLNGNDSTPYFKLMDGIRAYADDRDCLTLVADFLPEPIVTNDIVTFLTPNTFQFTGRFDNIINSGGVKVSAEKVEVQLRRRFDEAGITNHFFIAGVPDEKLGSKVALIIEAGGNFPQSLEKKFPEIYSSLSPFERPRDVYTLPSFSYTESGKINRVQSLKKLSYPR